MAAPTSVLRTLRPELSTFEELSLEMQRRGYVGTRILPAYEVRVASGTFSVITLESLLAAANADTKRTANGGYNRGTYTFDERTFTTKENGWEEPVDERESNMYAQFFDQESVAASRAWEHVLCNLERRIIAATVGAAVIAGRTTAATAVWTNVTTSRPITDIFTAQEAIWARTGIWPRCISMSRRAFRSARRSEQVVNSVQSGGAGSAAKQTDVTLAMLAEVFDCDQIIVADSIRNTANAGQAAVLDSVFPENQVMVSVAATSGDFKEPCLGRTFNWGGDGSQIGADGLIGVVETYEEPQTRKYIVRARHETSEFILYPECAQVVTGVR